MVNGKYFWYISSFAFYSSPETYSFMLSLTKNLTVDHDFLLIVISITYSTWVTSKKHFTKAP